MKRLLIVVAMFMLAVTGGAQDFPETDSAPFVRALAAIPAGKYVDDAGPLVVFGAYHEALAAGGLDVPQNWEEYDAGDWRMIDRLIPELEPYSPFVGLKQRGSGYREFVGFDFFEIEYAAAFGLPPYTGYVLFGTFDTAAVIDAHTARGYTIERQGDSGTLLCPPDGCDTGIITSPEHRDFINPFGGVLGRREPIFVADGLILNSPDIMLLEHMISVREGRRESLADRPEYQTLIAALDGLAFTRVEVNRTIVRDRVNPRSQDTQMLLESAPLPRYAFRAQTALETGDSAQSANILIYEDRADANAAASAIETRYDLPLFQHLRDREDVISYRQYAELSGGELLPVRVLPDLAEGWSAVVTTINAEITQSTHVATSGMYMPLVSLLDVTDDD